MPTRPRILLHICCAPDATSCCEQLAPHYQVIGYFHNPNIHPPEEYFLRLENVRKVAASMNFHLEPSQYNFLAWEMAVAGLENEPERGKRCDACFYHNLAATAAKAREIGVHFFTTTLAISPHKNTQNIFAAGREAAAKYDVCFVEKDFKLKHGFQRSLELSRQLGLYRQNYCGCKYSIRLHA